MTLILNIRVGRSGFEVDVDLTIDRTAALTGASGSGKSTVLRAIAGVEPDALGTIMLDGHVWMTPDRRVPSTLRSVGYLAQRDGLFPHMTAEDNVAYPLRADGVGRSKRRRSAAELLERLDLAEFRERRPHELSGGQRRRVALARALSAPRDLYLLDEPLAGLDDRTALLATDFIADQLTDLDANGLIAVHSDLPIRRFVSRVIRLNRGRVVNDVSVPAAAPSGQVSVRAPQSIGDRQLDCRGGSR